MTRTRKGSAQTAGGRRAILLGPVARVGAALRRQLADLRITPRDFLVGVDGGTRTWFALGYTPTFAVGDWDSLDTHRRLLERVPHLTLPTDKDRSDLFFAMEAARELGAASLICLGVTGGRPDHHQASLMEMALLSSQFREPIAALDPDARYLFFASGRPAARGVHWKEKLSPGQTVSLFAMDGPVKGVHLRGFEYALEGESLFPSSRGLSNRVARKNCEIDFQTGKLMVIVPHGSDS